MSSSSKFTLFEVISLLFIIFSFFFLSSHTTTITSLTIHIRKTPTTITNLWTVRWNNTDFGNFKNLLFVVLLNRSLFFFFSTGGGAGVTSTSQTLSCKLILSPMSIPSTWIAALALHLTFKYFNGLTSTSSFSKIFVLNLPLY